MNWQEKNNDVYNKSAAKMAEYFNGYGPRIKDIDRALDLANKKTGAKVIELGCGDGRDATEIVKRVDWYEGIDPSIELLKIAKNKLPNTSFVLSDAIKYEYPKNIDVIFAFASLLHININDLKKVFKKAKASLRVGGVLFALLKERPVYTEEVKKDDFGERMFYYYNLDIIKEIADGDFDVVNDEKMTYGSTDWFSVVLKRK